MRDVTYLRPRTLSEAVQLYRTTPGCRPLAGGTDLMVMLHARTLRPEPRGGAVLDLWSLAELKGVRRHGDMLEIGGQSVGDVDGSGGSAIGEPTRLAQSRDGMREASAVRRSRFAAARPRGDSRGGAAKASGDVDDVSWMHSAARERSEGGAENRCR